MEILFVASEVAPLSKSGGLGDVAAAESFERAIQSGPNYATGHQWFAFLLIARGQVEEALVEAHMSQELDPASVSIRRGLAGVSAPAGTLSSSPGDATT